MTKLLGPLAMVLLAASAVACGGADNGPVEQQTTGTSAEVNAQASGFMFICMPAYYRLWGYGRCSTAEARSIMASPRWHETQPGVWKPTSAACNMDDPDPDTAECCYMQKDGTHTDGPTYDTGW